MLLFEQFLQIKKQFAYESQVTNNRKIQSKFFIKIFKKRYRYERRVNLLKKAIYIFKVT